MENSENLQDIKQFYKDQVLGKYIRVVLDDDRKIYVDAIQEISEKYVAPINENLKFFVKNELRPEKYLNIPESLLKDEEQKKILDKEFRKNKFYIGQVIIPGKNIKKLEIQA